MKLIAPAQLPVRPVTGGPLAVLRARFVDESQAVGNVLRRLDWRWLEQGAILVFALMLPLAFGVEVVSNVAGHMWGFDYHGGLWAGGRQILAGANPYPPAVPERLLVPGNAMITPPLLALLNLPLALLPFGMAIVLWNVVQTASLVAALWLCGLRDWRGFVLGIASFPFVATLALGQPDGLFALVVALAWRYRDRWQGGLAIGLLVAAKLFAWPLVIWFLLTRRYRNGAISVLVALVLTVSSWAAIGFDGLAQYPRLLTADSDAFASRSHAILSFLIREGVGLHGARFLAAGLGLALSALLAHRARGSDVATFAAMSLVGLLLSPIMWSHYLVLLIVPLALANPRPNRWWLIYVLMWLSPTEPPSSALKILLVIALACAMTAFGTNGPSADRPSKPRNRPLHSNVELAPSSL